MNYQEHFTLMCIIYLIVLIAIIFGVVIALMIKAKKRYKKSMTDDNMKLTEGFNNGKTHLHFQGFWEKERQKNKK